MSDYSFSDINEAKRRVQEMKNKAMEHSGEKQGSVASLIASLQSNRDKALAVSLVYLMTCDSIDESLILAILYILFN